MSQTANSDTATESDLTGIRRISRTTLHDAVANQVRDMIIDGSLAPGTRINEVQLGTSLGVSRTPLREAIKTLASEGLVDMVPARGAVVHRFTATDIAEILEVIKMLEQSAAIIACERSSEAQIEEIRQMHAAMLQHYAARDRLSYFKLNQAIHSAIVSCAANATLQQTHDTLQARIRRIRFVGHDGPDLWAAAVAEHEEMIEALTARDGARLAEVLGRHLDMALVRVRDRV